MTVRSRGIIFGLLMPLFYQLTGLLIVYFVVNNAFSEGDQNRDEYEKGIFIFEIIFISFMCGVTSYR